MTHRTFETSQTTVVAAEPIAQTVLIVDDNVVDRRRAGALVDKIPGLVAAYAESGDEAVQSIANGRPAVILSDLQMPGMDGLSLVEEVRRRFPEIPIILMTAQGSEEIAIQALRAGAASYVPKRLLATELESTLRQILGISAAGQRRRRLLDRMKSQTSRYELESDPALIPPLVEMLLEDLDRMVLFDPTATTRIGVALQEALTNAIFHGSLELASNLNGHDVQVLPAAIEERRREEPYASRVIQIEAQLDREAATYIIRDEGPGFDSSLLGRSIDLENLMRTDGRGLLLIRTFMDEAWFDDQGRQITLVKRGTNPRPNTMPAYDHTTPIREGSTQPKSPDVNAWISPPG
jgi:CheY-like chemotaxis protein